ASTPRRVTPVTFRVAAMPRSLTTQLTVRWRLAVRNLCAGSVVLGNDGRRGHRGVEDRGHEVREQMYAYFDGLQVTGRLIVQRRHDVSLAGANEPHGRGDPAPLVRAGLGQVVPAVLDAGPVLRA